jgi:hypothetical protein
LSFGVEAHAQTTPFPCKEIVVQSIVKFAKAFWAGWKKVGRFIGDIIGRGVLMIFYVTVALPFGLGVRLFWDPLKVKDRSTPVHWIERTSPEGTLESSLNQF